MFKQTSLSLVISLIFLSIPTLHAQKIPKIAVEIVHSGDDIVGNRLVYNIKEIIRESSFLRLTYSDEARIVMSIITLEVYEDTPSIGCAYSVTWALDGTFWHTGDAGVVHRLHLKSMLGTTYNKYVKSSAESIVADTDELAEDYLFIFD